MKASELKLISDRKEKRSLPELQWLFDYMVKKADDDKETERAYYLNTAELTEKQISDLTELGYQVTVRERDCNGYVLTKISWEHL